MNAFKLTCCIFLSAHVCCMAQDMRPAARFSLQDIVNLARQNSSAALQAATIKENRYWQWKTFRSNYKPQLVLGGQLPGFSRTNIAVTQPNGTVEFKAVSNDNSQLSLSLVQNIGISGAQVSVNSSLLRFHDFDRRQTRYNGNPLIIGLTQPLFAFNPLAWDKKTESLRYEESQKQYTEDLEQVGLTATSLFFNLLLSQVNHALAKKNKANSDTLLRIGNLKTSMGQLSRDELLQLQLGALNAGKAVAQAELDRESALFDLNSYIGFSSARAIELSLPEEFPAIAIDEQLAVQQARMNKQRTVEFRRALIEAARDVAQAKGENGLNASIRGTFGLSNSAVHVSGIYRDPRDQQTLAISLQIPLMDWGRSASRIKTAQANQKLVSYTIAQQEENFDREISMQVKKFNMIRSRMKDNAEADRTAQERYQISMSRYLLGDLGITDLNIALQEKDQAGREHIQSLRNFWEAWYNLRVLTLYDFENGRKITDN